MTDYCENIVLSVHDGPDTIIKIGLFIKLSISTNKEM